MSREETEMSVSEEQILSVVMKVMSDTFLGMGASLKNKTKKTAVAAPRDKKKQSFVLASPEMASTIRPLVEELRSNDFFGATSPKGYTISDGVVYNKNSEAFIRLDCDGDQGAVKYIPNHLIGFVASILRLRGKSFRTKYIFQLLAVDKEGETIQRSSDVFRHSTNMKGGVKLIRADENVNYVEQSHEEKYYNMVRYLWSLVPDAFPDSDLPIIPIVIKSAIVEACGLAHNYPHLVTSYEEIVSRLHGVTKEAMTECLTGYAIDRDTIDAVRRIMDLYTVLSQLLS